MDKLASELVRVILDAADTRRATTGYCQSLASAAPPTHLLALGKAAIPMAHAAQSVLAPHLQHALVISTPPSTPPTFEHPTELLIADHPLATQRNLDAARRTLDFVRTLPADARLLALISGGGSALLTLPTPPLTLNDITTLSDALMRAGCDIRSLNTIRKHIEQLKGGRLAKLTTATHTRVALVSDVIGNDLSTIASGPFAPDPTTFADALSTLEAFDGLNIAPNVTRHLQQGAALEHEETPKPGDALFAGIEHEIILNNETAVQAAATALKARGRSPHVESNWTAESTALGTHGANLLKKHDAVVIGGEPIVTGIAQSSIGGPMQEAALTASLALENAPHDWLVLALATDGRDGPTNAAGAWLDAQRIRSARAQSLPIEQALAHHDTHPLLKRIGTLIETGPTGTNINDVLILLRR